MKRHLAALAILPLVLLSGAGCGGSDDGTDSPPAQGAEASPTPQSALDQIEAEVAEISEKNADDRPAGTVTKTDTDLVVEFPMSENLSNDLILNGYHQDSLKILQVIQDSKAKVKEVTIGGMYPLQDNKGNALGDKRVATMVFNDVYELNLENLHSGNISQAADSYVVHPALR